MIKGHKTLTRFILLSYIRRLYFDLPSISSHSEQLLAIIDSMKHGAIRTRSYDLEEMIVEGEISPLISDRVSTSEPRKTSFAVLAFVVISLAALACTGYSAHSTFINETIKPILTVEQRKGLELLSSITSKEKHIFSDMSPTDIALLFEGFIAKYSKKFKDEEEKLSKLDIFKENLAKIDKNNEDNISSGGKIVHGLTKYADMTFDEFHSNFLTASKRATALSTSITHAKVSPFQGPLSNVDWSGIYSTPVTDQGLCGACWAFSSINQVESDAIRAGQLKVTDHLSTEQLITCTTDAYGCQGGWTESGFEYIHRHGISTFSDYPYTEYWDQGKVPTCVQDPSSSLVSVVDVFTLDSEDQMIDYVKGVGPLSICIDATNWQLYSGGVMTYCGNQPNHCVQIVGVNTDEGYWKVRNNWGVDWGEDGYIRLATGQDLCGITTDPHFTSTSLVPHDTITIRNVSLNAITERLFIDKPDPYITFSVGTQTYTTNVLKDATLHPTWPESFDVVWDGISDLKVNLYDSNWFFSDGLLGTMQLNLNSVGFPDHTFISIRKGFDNYESMISFSLRLNPLPPGENTFLLAGQTIRDGKVVDKRSGLEISVKKNY